MSGFFHWPKWARKSKYLQTTTFHPRFDWLEDRLVLSIFFASDRDGNREIYMMNADGSNQTRITNTTLGEFGPKVSPDGGKIAFNWPVEGDADVYLMDADGTNRIQLTSAAGNDYVGGWSPDGSKIAFQSHRDGNWEIYVMNTDGSNQTRLTSSAATDEAPRWSPDGSNIVFDSNRDGNFQVYVMNSDGSNQTRITDTPATNNAGPSWSPDGNRIAFFSDRNGNREIYVMNADGSNQIRLTDDPGMDEDPVWSPDGSEIAFFSDRDGNSEIYVMNSDGFNQTRLTNNPALDVNPDWVQPDSGFHAPFTVITHGFQLGGGLERLPDWTIDMRTALSGWGVTESVIVDWRTESNNASPGWTEDVGDELFARIMWQIQHESRPIDVHFIGHSRGTVVNSEANERLAYYGAAFPAISRAVDEVQVTMLDAHPANNTVGASGLQAFVDVLEVFESFARDPNPVIWNNVTWSDAYFQRSNFVACFRSRGGPRSDGALNPHGVDFRSNIFSLEMTQELLGAGDRLCHNDFGPWYTDTIMGTIPNQGYYHSLAQPGWISRPAPQSPAGMSPSAPLRVFNGTFDFRGSHLLETDIPGWRGSNIRVLGDELRLRAKNSSAASVTHNPLFVAPDMRSLEFNVERIGQDQNATLSVYFVPVQDTLDPNGELVSGTPRLLQSWSLGELSPGLKRMPLGLAESELGQVGGIKFSLSSTRGATADALVRNARQSP